MTTGIRIKRRKKERNQEESRFSRVFILVVVVVWISAFYAFWVARFVDNAHTMATTRRMGDDYSREKMIII